uniref:Uncharacterized protein n=1 Tax=Romanomermis culicivorax TaxID=13658 RepID=A0A915L0A2_ROMCU
MVCGTIFPGGDDMTIRFHEPVWAFLSSQSVESAWVNWAISLGLDGLNSLGLCLSLPKMSTVGCEVEFHCKWLNHFSGCIQSRIVADCGLKAWTIIHRVLKDTATTLMPNCLFSSHNVLPSSKKGQQQQSRTMINDRQQSPYTTYGNNTIQSTNKYDINFVGNKDRTSLEARRNARLNNNGRNSSNDHLIKSHLLFIINDNSYNEQLMNDLKDLKYYLNCDS